MTIDMTIDNLMGKSESHLEPLEGLEPHRMFPVAKQAFLKMREAAAADGIEIAIASSFRPYDRQLAIWNEKYMGDRVVLDNHDRPVNVSHLTGVEACYAILYWSALPGLSRHHWGTDIDVWSPKMAGEGYELKLIGAEYAKDGPFAALTEWLDANMEKFGFYRPFTDDAKVLVGSEPWHISHRASAQLFEKLITKEIISDAICNNPLAGKSCLRGMVDELFESYVIHG